MGDVAKTVLPLVAIAGLGIATGGFGLAAAAPAAVGASAAAAGAGTAAASASIFSAGNLALVGAGLSAIGTGVGFLGKQQELKVQEAQQRLEVEEARRDTEERLAQTLSANNVLFGALGIQPGSGSASNVQTAAVADAGREDRATTASSRLARERISSARRNNAAGSLLKIGALGIQAAGSFD